MSGVVSWSRIYNKKTRWGHMIRFSRAKASVPAVEVMRFDSKGTTHAHYEDELVTCIAGCGDVVIDGKRHRLREGEQLRVPAGAMHRMEPSFPSASMTCVVHYEGPKHGA